MHLLLEIIKLVSGEVIELRSISKEEAKAKVKEYISTHPGCLTSDIIQELRLDPLLVASVLEELEKEDKIEGRDISERKD